MEPGQDVSGILAETQAQALQSMSPSSQSHLMADVFHESVLVVSDGLQSSQFDPDLVVDKLSILHDSIEAPDVQNKLGFLIDRVQTMTQPIMDPGQFVKEAFSASQKSVSIDIEAPPNSLFLEKRGTQASYGI